MGRKFTIIIEKDSEGFYFSEVIGLPGCHTQGDTVEELITNTREAIKAYLESEDVKETAESFVGVQQIEV